MLCLIRSLENRLAPINRFPPDVLTLVPDSWDVGYKYQGVVTLTHIRRAWREILISRSSLWTKFDCVNADKIAPFSSVQCPLPSTCICGGWLDCVPTIPSSISSLAPLDDSNPCPPTECRKVCKTSPLTYLALFLISSICRWTAVVNVSHNIVPCSRLPSSMETSRRCASFTCSAFVPS